MPEGDVDGVEASYFPFFEWIQKLVARYSQETRLDLGELKTVAGVDVAYGDGKAVAAAVKWDVEQGRTIEVSFATGKPLFPYKSGFLFLREGPFMVEAAKGLKGFDVILVDGHGAAHPRGAGLAVFVGAALSKPSIGVAKSILVGEAAPSDEAFSPMFLHGVVVGYAVKPKGSRGYYASPGFGLQVEDVTKVLSRLGVEYPQVLRQAHLEAKRRLKAHG